MPGRSHRPLPTWKCARGPIAMVMERWYSEELEADVLRRNTDPRFGETTYKLINVVLGEPSPDLFVVPNGYELRTEPNGPFEFKLEHS